MIYFPNEEVIINLDSRRKLFFVNSIWLVDKNNLPLGIRGIALGSQGMEGSVSPAAFTLDKKLL